MGHSDLIGSREARARLNLPRTTFYRHVQKGLIPYAHQLPGATGVLLFDPAVISRIAADRDRPREQRGSTTTGRRGAADFPLHGDTPATTAKAPNEN